VQHHAELLDIGLFMLQPGIGRSIDGFLAALLQETGYVYAADAIKLLAQVVAGNRLPASIDVDRPSAPR
jgi:hypothetical protein